MSGHAKYFDGMTLAGDTDRSRAVVTLRDATVEGRLTLDEFADRVERAELARTVGDAPRLRIRTSGLGGTLRLKTSRDAIERRVTGG